MAFTYKISIEQVKEFRFSNLKNWLRRVYFRRISFGEQVIYGFNYSRGLATIVGVLCFALSTWLLSLDHPLTMLAHLISPVEASESVSKPTQGTKVDGHQKGSKVEYDLGLIEGQGGKKVERGDFIPGRLSTAVDSSRIKSPVQIELINARDFGLEDGATMLGEVSEVKKERIFVMLNILKMPDGRAIDVSGEVLSADGSAGLIGDFETNRGENALGAGVASFMSGATAGMLNFPTENSGYGTYARNAFISGSSESANKLADVYTEDMRTPETRTRVGSGQPVVILLKSEIRI
jgi:hypothetical protein